MQDKLTTLLKAIGDPTRRDIFHALVVASMAMPINQISAQFNITRQGVTKHLKTLEEAGLVQISTTGRERYCFADPKPLQEVLKWLNTYDKFWDDSLDKLGNYLSKKKD